MSYDFRHGTLAGTALEHRCPLDQRRHTATASSSLQGLGALARLPPEILFVIFPQLDVQTLINCRRLSRRAMHVINGLPEYRDLRRFLPNALRGVLSIESGSYITCQTLHQAIFRRECENPWGGGPSEPVCRRTGEFICLFTGRRLCAACLVVFDDRSRMSFPMLFSEVENLYGLEEEDLAGLPTFKNVPGYYTPTRIDCTKRHRFVDGLSATNRAIELHGSWSSVREDQVCRIYAGLMSGVLCPPLDITWRLNELKKLAEDTHINPFACQLRDLPGRRFMTAMIAPWVNPERDSLLKVPRNDVTSVVPSPLNFDQADPFGMCTRHIMILRPFSDHFPHSQVDQNPILARQDRDFEFIWGGVLLWNLHNSMQLLIRREMTGEEIIRRHGHKLTQASRALFSIDHRRWRPIQTCCHSTHVDILVLKNGRRCVLEYSLD